MREFTRSSLTIEVRNGPNAFDAPGLMDGVLAVYATAFGSPPWNESADRVAGYRTRAAAGATHEDFVLAVARSAEGRVVGFSTAWTTPDPFPTGRMYDDLAATLDPVVIRDRLVGRTEVEELAVLADVRGAGVGRRLLSEVTRGPTGGAWLVTAGFAEAAVRLYRSGGWESVGDVDGGEYPLTVFATPVRTAVASTAN